MSDSEAKSELAKRLLSPLATILRGEKGHGHVQAWLAVATTLGLTLKDLVDEVDRQKNDKG